MSDHLEVVLWGESQVGKTTALAAYLCHKPPAWLDRTAEETIASLALLNPLWTAVNENRLVRGTAHAQTYTVRHRDQRRIRFRDMRGGNAGSLSPDDLAALRAAAAVLVFTGWPGERDVVYLRAVNNALLMNQRDVPTALVVTKVESFLTLERLGLFLLESPEVVARRVGLPGAFIELMERFPAVFLISVYGYKPEGLPAHYRDEFGRLVPWEIRPKNVGAPFDYVIERLP